MNHPLLVTVFYSVAGYCAYLAMLAMVCISRDPTLTAVNKFGRMFLALLLPLIGAAIAIRSTAETAPDVLPGRAWMWPARFFISEGVEPTTP